MDTKQTHAQQNIKIYFCRYIHLEKLINSSDWSNFSSLPFLACWAQELPT